VNADLGAPLPFLTRADEVIDRIMSVGYIGGEAGLAVRSGLDKVRPQQIPTKRGYHRSHYSEASMRAPMLSNR
jgi:hypothetical protein